MKYTKDSGLVQLYVRLLSAGAKTMEQVPKIGNLQEAVHDALHELAEENTALVE